MSKKITLYITTSSDGFIAAEDGSVAWLDQFNNVNEDYGYDEFVKSIDVVVMGNTTYEQVLSFNGEYPYKKQKNFVFANKEGSDQYATFVSGDVTSFAENVEGNVWLVGGANLAQQFFKEHLIDEFIIFIMPVELKKGIKLFEDGWEKKLLLEHKKEFPSGVVEFHYKKKCAGRI